MAGRAKRSRECGGDRVTNQELNDLARQLGAKIAVELQGDGAATYAISSFLGLKPAPTDIEPLTFGKLKTLLADFPPIPSPLRLIEVEPTPIYGPVRRHRKRRIQKKWLKRYGTGIVSYDYPMGDNVLMDEKRGVGYCHPHAARWIRTRTASRGESWPIL